MSLIDQGREIQTFYRDYGRLINTNRSLIYQYRDIDSFWKILESDCFWASNARFSNDKEEQTIGMYELNKLLDKSSFESIQIEDCYIICFCKDNDKLSQWRGYAPNGVSIGFDFHSVIPFYVENELMIYNSCYDVKYIEKDMSLIYLQEMFCVNKGESGNAKKLSKHIPYIKHKGFEEENECRLVFFNTKGAIDKYVHYRKGTVSEEIPYIKIGLSRENKDKKNCTIRLLLADTLANGKKIDEIFSRIQERTIALKTQVICCFHPEKTHKKDFDDNVCCGCLQRCISPMKDNKVNRFNFEKCGYSKNLGLDHNSTSHFMATKDINCIMISMGKNQERVFNIVDDIISEYNMSIDNEESKISVWCEGHLPIRQITVGPIENRERVKESIEHYCRTHYWLKYVKVIESRIPYRS